MKSSMEFETLRNCTIVQIIYVDETEQGKKKVYSTTFKSYFRQWTELLGAVDNSAEKGAPHDYFVFDLGGGEELFSTFNLFVPDVKISGAIEYALNAWTKRYGYPFAFKINSNAPFPYMEVTYPAVFDTSEFYEKMNGYVKDVLQQDINDAYNDIRVETIYEKAVVTEEDFDLLDDPNAVIVEVDDIDDSKGDSFKSELYEHGIEKGADQ